MTSLKNRKKQNNNLKIIIINKKIETKIILKKREKVGENKNKNTQIK